MSQGGLRNLRAVLVSAVRRLGLAPVVSIIDPRPTRSNTGPSISK
jgi:hypothetical protein